MTGLALLLALAGAATHQVSLEHRGTGYDLTYRPQIDTRVKTIGAAAGTRPDGQRCRWVADVRVERQIGTGMRTVLPQRRTVAGSVPGSCTRAQRATLTAQAAAHPAVRRHVAAVARTDRAQALADIDAARALASN